MPFAAMLFAGTYSSAEGTGIGADTIPVGSASYKLLAFQSLSMSQASRALIALKSAAEGSSDIGLADADGRRSNCTAAGGPGVGGGGEG